MLAIRACVICGKTFTPKKQASKQKTCCEAHSRENHRRRNNENAAKRRRDNPEREREYYRQWLAKNPGYHRQHSADIRAEAKRLESKTNAARRDTGATVLAKPQTATAGMG